MPRNRPSCLSFPCLWENLTYGTIHPVLPRASEFRKTHLSAFRDSKWGYPVTTLAGTRLSFISLCVPKVQDNTWRKISNDAVHIDVVYLTPLRIHLGLSLESLKFEVFLVAFTSKMAYSD